MPEFRSPHPGGIHTSTLRSDGHGGLQLVVYTTDGKSYWQQLSPEQVLDHITLGAAWVRAKLPSARLEG